MRRVLRSGVASIRIVGGAFRPFAAAALIVVLGLAPAALTHSTAIAASPPTFGEPTVSGVQGTGFEEGNRVAPNGTIYTSAPDSLSSTTSFVWRSQDGGQTFKWVPAAAQPTGKLPSCLGGGDSELAVDSANHLYFNDLSLANFSTARSDDGGVTFPAISCTSVSDTVVDRQWYTTDGDPTNGGEIFLTYDRVAQMTPVQCPGGIAAGVANPGNNVLVVAQSPLPGGSALAGTQYAPSQVLSCDEGIMGDDQFYNYADTGKTVFVPHDSANLSSVSVARCSVVPISATNPTGFTNCADVLVSSFPGSITGGDFPTLSVDRAGNLFMVWEQASKVNGAPGNTSLMFSTSTDEGNTWSPAQQIPTPGLANDVFAWPGSGDSGRVDVAFYGTPASCDTTCQSAGGGPDHVNGDWSLYMVQTLNNGQSWSSPILAGEHFIHRGSIQTLIGGQSGDRSVGDFLQLRIGPQGEANISYADTNNPADVAYAMFVRQNGGTSVYANPSSVHGTAAPVNAVSDPSGDATFDQLGTSSPNLPNLDILKSQISMPDPSHYQVVMKVANLTSPAPAPTSGGTDLVWLTRWTVPSSSDPAGGQVFDVYMESTGGGAPQCYAGSSAFNANGGGVLATYPGSTQLTGTACTYTATAPGTITITVPTADVSEANPISPILYSVTAATMTLSAPANSVPNLGGIGGVPANLVDVAPGYDFNPSGKRH